MNKRALVVDDSRSARISLQKMLDKYGIAVDFAESGEEALSYLKHHLVDAIFLDHTMPGMDGLETVVAIKSNPRTATIPVMMYTAKEGEVYVSQARALGAIGVVPKQVQPGVLQEMLRKLGLLRDESGEAGTPAAPSVVGTEPPAGAAAPPPAAAITAADSLGAPKRLPESIARDAVDARYDQQALGASVQALITRVLDEQHLRLRSDILSAHRDFARQVAAEILAKDRSPAPGGAGPSASGPVPGAPSTSAPPPRRLSMAWLLLLPLLVLGALLWQARDTRDRYATEFGRLQSALEQAERERDELREARDRSETDQRTRANGRYLDLVRTVEWALNQDGRVGFDEPAFDDRRAAALETLLAALVDAGFRGTVRLEAHLGEFCLVNDASGGYRLAAPGAALDECDRLGHPLDQSTNLSERQSAGFAGFLANSPLLDDTGVRIELIALDRAGSDPGDPVPATITTAGDWNALAGRNHRVSYTITADAPR